ncbi:MAG: glycosyltransferase [Candidatus Doudnabacteria bacterium]
MKISILIPAYHEQDKISQTIDAVQNTVQSLPYLTEIIVICDGKEDKTYEIASTYNSHSIIILGYPQNRGKGYALKYGFNHASGDLIIFFDAGLEFDPAHIIQIINYYQKFKVPVIIGSKRHPQSRVIYPLKRQVLSRAAQLMVKTLFQMDIKDSQVGLKLFERKVLAEIFPKVLVKKYAFDIELLALAHHYGYKIMEIPVNLEMDFSHSSICLSAINKSFWDTMAVFYRLKILRYYDQPSEKRKNILKKYQKN